MKLPGRSVNPALSTPDREVILIEAVPCSTGDQFSLRFESVGPGWRQGVWLAVDGTFAVEDHTSSQVVLWSDTAPDHVELEVREAGDGLCGSTTCGTRVGDVGHGSRRVTPAA